MLMSLGTTRNSILLAHAKCGILNSIKAWRLKMLYPKIEDCVAQIGCKYTLTIITAKRAKDLSMKMPANFASSKTKELSFALREINDGKITVARVGETPIVAGA